MERFWTKTLGKNNMCQINVYSEILSKPILFMKYKNIYFIDELWQELLHDYLNEVY